LVCIRSKQLPLPGPCFDLAFVTPLQVTTPKWGSLREATRRDEQEDANWGYCFSLAGWSRLTDNYLVDGWLQASQ